MGRRHNGGDLSARWVEGDWVGWGEPLEGGRVAGSGWGEEIWRRGEPRVQRRDGSTWRVGRGDLAVGGAKGGMGDDRWG